MKQDVSNLSGKRCMHLLRQTFGTATIVTAMLLAASAGAGKSWLSGMAGDGWTRPFSAMTESPRQGPKQTSATMIDLVVSLYEKDGAPDYPAGDGEGNTQGAPGSEEQDRYEEVFQHMADAVFEATEGAHIVRNVRIYRGGGHIPRSDIVWGGSGVIDSVRNGVDGPGGHIWMYDVFTPGGLIPDLDMLESPERRQAAGYILAHELGHYLYGAGDEYKILETDIPVENSLMNSPWRAVPEDGGEATAAHYAWLNFSIRWQGDPAGPWEDTRYTDQHRLYQESVWRMLGRDPRSDPKLADLNAEYERMHFPELAEAAPPGFSTPTINLPSDAARGALDITWLTNEIVYEIILDRSGSMRRESKLDHAKLAAQNLVAQAELYSTKIGVVMFDQVVEVLTPITDVNSQEVIDSINALIEVVTSGSGTPLGDAAQLGLDELTALGTENDTKVAFLLSDGKSNRGVDPLSVIAGYQEAQIPLFVFAYGSAANIYTLGRMATETGGELFISPVSLAEVTEAFVRANRRARGWLGLSSDSFVTSGAPVFSPFEVDSSVGRLNINVVHDGQAGDAEVLLVAPGGAVVDATLVSSSPLETIYLFSAGLPVPGTWTLQVTPQIEGTINVSYQVTAVPEGASYALTVASSEGQALVYPEPMLITAVLERERPITGANLLGIVTDPLGDDYELSLADDGIAPDAEAGDGRYSGVFPYQISGTYNIAVLADNLALTAEFTHGGSGAVPAPDGTAPVPPPNTPVGERFERETRIQITVDGVVPDDHGNTPDLATLVLANNGDTPGRIEIGGDADFFVFAAPLDVQLLTARVTGMAGGMDPVLTIYGEDGVSILAEGDLETNASDTGFLLLDFGVESGAAYYASVRHTSATAIGGFYQFSAGVPTKTDEALNFYLLTTQARGGGAVSPASGATYLAGSTVSIEATPASGWVFDRWEGNVTDNSSATTSILINTDETVTAVFKQPVTLSISVTGSGTTVPDVGDSVYVAGETVALTAAPAEGWIFDRWEGNVADSASATTSILLNADETVTAVFIQQTTLTISVEGEGATTPAAGSWTYLEGESVALLATADVGWEFDHWVGAVDNGGLSITAITMNGDQEITAVFVQSGSGKAAGCYAGSATSGSSAGDTAVWLTLAFVLLIGAVRKSKTVVP